MEFEKIAQVLKEIACTSSIKNKIKLLIENANLSGFKKILAFIYDNSFTTGIKKTKLERFVDEVSEEEDLRPEAVMDYFKRFNTGSAKDVAYANSFIDQYEDKTCKWLATGIVTKDLQIGITTVTLNAVYGNSFIPKIGIMRGMNCKKNINGYYIATEKLDGNRRLVFKTPEGIKIYTRSGKQDSNWKYIEEEMISFPYGVYDCELLADGEFEDSIQQRQATTSIANSNEKNKTGCSLHCFDYLTLDEYEKGKSDKDAFERKLFLSYLLDDIDSFNSLFDTFCAQNIEDKEFLKDIYKNKNLRIPIIEHPHVINVPFLGIVRNYDEAQNLAKSLWENGREGIMLIEASSKYIVSPNPQPTLLKVKSRKEYILECVEVYEGEKKNKGLLGGIKLKYIREDGIQWIINCGSGFPDNLRKEYWENPDHIIGKYVEIEAFGESQNINGEYNLNHASFKRVLNDYNND